MTFKNSAQRILAYVHPPPMQMSHNISGVTGSKFTKFLSCVDESLSMFKQQSALRYSHPLCDPSTRCQMRGATLKKKVASAKHKPAGGIAMLHARSMQGVCGAETVVRNKYLE